MSPSLLLVVTTFFGLFLPPPGTGVTARLSLCEDGGAEDSKEREPEEEEGH